MLHFFNKNPCFISVMHTVYRNVVIVGHLLFLSLDAFIAAGAWQGCGLQSTKPYLDAYICVAIDTSMLKNSHIEQL